MSDLERVREILAKAAGVNDNGTGHPGQGNGQENGQTFIFNAPVTVNLFWGSRAGRDQLSPLQAAPRPAISVPLAGQALLSPGRVRAVLAAQGAPDRVFV